MYKKTLCILLCFFIQSCRSYDDLSKALDVQEIYRLPLGTYSGIAWPDSQMLVIAIDRGPQHNQDGLIIFTPQMQLLNLQSKEIKSLSINTSCETFFIRSLQVLPNKHIGYILDCRELNSQTIQEMNTNTNKSTDIYVESAIRFLGKFAYSADMSELSVVDVKGLFLKSIIYRLDMKGNKEPITVGFLRADFPVWSLKENRIAFLGTKAYPGSEKEIKHFSDTEARLDYPWRLYLYDPQQLTTEELPIDIVGPSQLKWSPDGEMLAFSGEYKGIPGVWIVGNLANIDKLSITRVIDGLAVFDFSPDSKLLAYAYIGLQNKDKQSTLYVLDLQSHNQAAK